VKIVINIDVPALGPAVAFYTAALGLTHSRTLDDDVAELTGASATLYLLQKRAATAAVKAPPVERDYGRHWTPVHFDLVVPDVDAAAARAIAAGAKQETGHVDRRG
jgi:predicted enzyme related to lactoylglutathione lyase